MSDEKKPGASPSGEGKPHEGADDRTTLQEAGDSVNLGVDRKGVVVMPTAQVDNEVVQQDADSIPPPPPAPDPPSHAPADPGSADNTGE
jgi:hypothetical protein